MESLQLAKTSRRDSAIVALARSAWETQPQQSRPVGYGLIRAGVGTDSTIGGSKFRTHRPRTFQEAYLNFLRKTAQFRREIPLGLAALDHTVPMGRFLRGTLSQALRARLRSVVPTGHAFRHRNSVKLCSG
jgi:hypothetical protein